MFQSAFLISQRYTSRVCSSSTEMSDHGPGQSSARTVPAGVAPLKRRPPRSCRNVTLGSPPLVCPMDWKLPWHTYGFFIVSSSSSSSSSVGRLLFLCSARLSPRLTALSSAKRSVSVSRHVFLVLQDCQPKDCSFSQRISHVFRSRISPCRNSYVYTGARGRRPRPQRRQTVDQVIRESR